MSSFFLLYTSSLALSKNQILEEEQQYSWSSQLYCPHLSLTKPTHQNQDDEMIC